MKNKILTVIIIVFLCGVTWLICDTVQSDMVDFRGYVDEVSYNTEDGSAVIRATGIYNSESFTFRVAKRVSIKDSEGEKISVDQIKPGDMIDIDYNGSFDNETKSADVRRAEVWSKP